MDEVYTRKRSRKSAPIADAKLNQQFNTLTCKDEMKYFKQSTIKGDVKQNFDKQKNTKSICGEIKNLRTETVGASVMRIEKIKRKTEVCKRHVPQLLIRGEHVASVVLL